MLLGEFKTVSQCYEMVLGTRNREPYCTDWKGVWWGCMTVETSAAAAAAVLKSSPLSSVWLGHCANSQSVIGYCAGNSVSMQNLQVSDWRMKGQL